MDRRIAWRIDKIYRVSINNKWKNELVTVSTKINYCYDWCKFSYDMNTINKSFYKLELMLNGKTDKEILDKLNEVKNMYINTTWVVNCVSHQIIYVDMFLKN